MENKENITEESESPEIMESHEENIEGSSDKAQSHEELTLLLEDARNKADDHWNLVLKTQADLENLRKRQARELENAHKYALEKFVNELLPIRDSMEMGISAADGENIDPAKLKEGMDLTLKLLSDMMEKFDIKEVNPEGEKFNPDLHQAMSMQESSELEPNTVMAVMQKGYLLNDRLVRPAMVIVSKAG
jgi:molecular chaperone GrpE